MRSASPFPSSSLNRKLTGNGQSLCPIAVVDQARAYEVGNSGALPNAQAFGRSKDNG
jgi:hypothetical protein